MKLIYLILIHKDIEQVNALIDSIWDENISIYVHIDKKYKANTTNLNSKAIAIQNNVSVLWGDYSVVQATLNSIAEIDKNETNYSHICLLSGQDYPIKSNKDIRNAIKGKEDYLDYCEIYKQTKWRVHHRFEGWYYTKRFSVLRSISWYSTRFHQKYLNIKRKQLPGVVAFGGSQWWTLSKESIQFILDFVNNPANKKFVNYFKWMCCCDENFFHCILCNSNRKENIINNNFRYIDWYKDGASPETLTDKDYEKIIQSNKLFCRKIDSVQSKELIEMLNKHRNNDA